MKSKFGIRKWICMLLALVLTVGSMAPAAVAAEKSFSLRLEAQVEGASVQEINDVLSGSSISLTGRGQDGRGILNLQVDAAGMSLFRLLLQIGENKLAFSLPDVSSKRYEISAQRLAELIGSQIRTDDGVSLEELAPQMLTGPGLEEGELEEALAPYLAMLSEHFENCVRMDENVQISQEKLGNEVAGNLLTYEPGAQQLADLFVSFAEYMETDETLARVVDTLADYVQSLGGLVEVTPFYTEDTDTDPDNAAENLRETFRQFPRALREAAGSLQEADPALIPIRFRVGMPVSTEEDIVPILISAELFGEAQSPAEVRFGFESFKDGQARDTCMYATDGQQELVLRMSGSGTESSRQGDLSVLLQGKTLFSTVYNWDMTKRSLIGAPYGTLVVTMAPVILTLITGDAGQGQTRHRLMVTGLEDMTFEEVSGLTVDLITSDQGEAEAPSGTVTDISGFSMDELLNLGVELAGEIAGQISGQLGLE